MSLESALSGETYTTSVCSAAALDTPADEPVDRGQKRRERLPDPVGADQHVLSPPDQRPARCCGSVGPAKLLPNHCATAG